MKLSEQCKKIIAAQEFLILATCNMQGVPNAAPMFLIKVEDEFVYLIDYTKGTTFKNLKVNPKASMSVADLESLKGLKLNGSVEMIEEGEVFMKITDDLNKMKIKLSAQKVAESVRGKKRNHIFELELPDHFVVYKVQIQEIIEITPQGRIHKVHE